MGPFGQLVKYPESDRHTKWGFECWSPVHAQFAKDATRTAPSPGEMEPELPIGWRRAPSRAETGQRWGCRLEEAASMMALVTAAN